MHWSHPVGWTSIIQHFFMISPHIDVDDIDPVIWSLIIEMKISLVFPLLIFIVTHTPRVVYALITLLLVITLTSPLHFVTHSSSSWSRAAILAPIFLFGSYLAKYRHETVSMLKASRSLRIAVAITGALLYALAWILPLQVQGFARYGCACGSGAFILLILASRRLQRVGTVRVTRFLGKVSYSFYLVHLPILIAVASRLYPLIHTLAAVITISLVSGLVAAWVIYAGVEVPAHNWGKKLAWSFDTRTPGVRTVPVVR